MHVASTGKHVLKKSPKLATHTTQCMAMLRKVHCVPANGSASHPPGAARHDAHFEAWETCENTTLSPTTGKGAFSGKKTSAESVQSPSIVFTSADVFRAPERHGPFRALFKGPKPRFPGTPRGREGTSKGHPSMLRCPAVFGRKEVEKRGRPCVFCKKERGAGHFWAMLW